MRSERVLPRHVALIMDGNGRWASRFGFLRPRGHQEGAAALRRITRHAARIGIQEVTFFALSTENFLRRPRAEVAFLMALLKEYLIGERTELVENNIRLVTIGRTEEFPEDVRREIATTVHGSSHHTGMTLRLALNYGARQELLEGIRRLAREAAEGRLAPDSIVEEDLRRVLYDPRMQDPDLLIRTGGEMRLSNFLLWQASYTELSVSDVLWPDFDVHHFEEALEDFARRDRKFGAITTASVGSPTTPRPAQ